MTPRTRIASWAVAVIGAASLMAMVVSPAGATAESILVDGDVTAQDEAVVVQPVQPRPQASPKPTRKVVKPRPKPSPKSRPKPKPSSDDRWTMVPMPQLPPYSDAVIKNSKQSTRTIRVCRDWGRSSCGRSSRTGTLKPGQNSRTKFGWHDTDGYDRGHGWTKQQGCFRCVVTVKAR